MTYATKRSTFSKDVDFVILEYPIGVQAPYVPQRCVYFPPNIITDAKIDEKQPITDDSPMPRKGKRLGQKNEPSAPSEDELPSFSALGKLYGLHSCAFVIGHCLMSKKEVQKWIYTLLRSSYITATVL